MALNMVDAIDRTPRVLGISDAATVRLRRRTDQMHGVRGRGKFHGILEYVELMGWVGDEKHHSDHLGDKRKARV